MLWYIGVVLSVVLGIHDAAKVLLIRIPSLNQDGHLRALLIDKVNCYDHAVFFFSPQFRKKMVSVF